MMDKVQKHNSFNSKMGATSGPLLAYHNTTLKFCITEKYATFIKEILLQNV
jgi:hypothetical protein